MTKSEQEKNNDSSRLEKILEVIKVSVIGISGSLMLYVLFTTGSPTIKYYEGNLDSKNIVYSRESRPSYDLLASTTCKLDVYGPTKKKEGNIVWRSENTHLFSIIDWDCDNIANKVIVYTADGEKGNTYTRDELEYANLNKKYDDLLMKVQKEFVNYQHDTNEKHQQLMKTVFID